MSEKTPKQQDEASQSVKAGSGSKRLSKGGKSKVEEAPSEYPELKPVKKDLGPTLILRDDKIRISFGIRQAVWPIGKKQDQAFALVTYETIIPKGEAVGFSNLSKEGYLLRGWLLVDGKGQVLGRLANDDEVVYDPDEAAAFAEIAGLRLDDWGKIHHKQIDELMKAPRTAKDEMGRPLQGSTGREWIMALGIVGGMMITWPVLSNILFSTSRQRGFLMLIIAGSGFLTGAVGLWFARMARHLSPRVTGLISGVLTTIFVALGAYCIMTPSIGIWRLTNTQVAIVLLGIALIAAITPFWAQIFRSKATPTD